MDCSVCTSAIKADPFQCPSCQFTTCKPCQKRYMLPNCMNCRLQFTRAFLVENLGASYVNTTLRDHITQTLLNREKQRLPESQQHVEYQTIVEAELARRRFGVRPNLPDRPITRETPSEMVFACPVTGCRGFVSSDRCGVCKADVCGRCRSVQDDGHECKKEDLESIEFLSKDTKPCPLCTALIYRTTGCSHMRCTHCGNHFDWVTLKPLKVSSNGHYNHIQAFASNAALRNQAGPACEDGNTSDDAVGKDLQSVRDPLLMQSLYDDPQAVRLTQSSMFNERQLETRYTKKLVDYRVKFMKQQISEKVWGQNIYRVEQQYERDNHIAQILHMYFNTLRQYQRLLMEHPENKEGLHSEWEGFLDMCNNSFSSIKQEYGGPTYKFGSSFTKNRPSFLIA